MTAKRFERFTAVLERELWTVARSRGFYALAGGFALLVFGLAFAMELSSYVPLVLSLLLPLEVVVPALAAAFGFRSVLADREREELTVLRTFPITPSSYILGIYVGRLVPLFVTIGIPLFCLWVAIPLFGGAETFLYQTSGLDSPVLYFRFVSLTLLFGAVLLSLMVLISSLVDTGRRALVLVIATVLVSTLGIDLVTIFATSGTSAARAAPALTAFGPNGAYRSLVLALVVGPVLSGGVDVTLLVVGAISLLLWLFAPLLVSSVIVWSDKV